MTALNFPSNPTINTTHTAAGKAWKFDGVAWVSLYTSAEAVSSFNTRTGAVELNSTDVSTALGFTPYSSANTAGYITIDSLNGYLPLTGGTLSGNAEILSLRYAADGGSALLAWKNSAGTTLWDIGGGIVAAQDELVIRRQGAQVVNLNAAGNLGLGTSPLAWHVYERALQFGITGALYNNINFGFTTLSNNTYRNAAGNDTYIYSNFATKYVQDTNGQHQWYIATPGAGGTTASFLQGMMLDANSNLNVVGTIKSGNAVTSGGNAGFRNDVYYAGVRNPIWMFGNATAFGISYFQGSAGVGGADTIGIHPNGNPTAIGSSFAVGTSNSYVNNNVILHAGNYSSYALPLSERWYQGWVLNPGYDANTLPGSRSGFTYANNAPLIGGLVHFDAGGYGFQLNAQYNGNGLSFRSRNGDTNAWNLWRTVVTDSNYSSYALPLSGGTLSGAITVNNTNQSFVAQYNGNAAQWYGQILSKNATSDRAAFLGTYGSVAGVFAHNNAMSAWADLYVNTVDGTTGGAVRLPPSVLVNGNQVLHAGNYTGYISILRALGAQSVSNDWDGLGNAYPNSLIQVTPSNFASTANGPTVASYTYGTLLSLSSVSSSKAQVYISHTGNDLIFRGGWDNGSWQAWNKVLTNQNYNSYSPTLTGGGASGTWGINITGNAATASTLQTARTINGIGFNGSANIKTTEWIHSDRDFASGTLVTTDINYAVSSGDPFIIEIRGNSYGDAVPYDIQYQGYIYADTIICNGGTSNGTNISGLVAINVGGNLCFWWPRQSYWNGFNVRVYTAYGSYALNRVMSITSTAKPSSTKEVGLSASIRQSLHSGNYTNYSPSLMGSGAGGTWAINITGSATNLSSTRTNWTNNGTISAVVGQLGWKNYGNNHTIFDASASTSPDGSGVNSINSAVPWQNTFPTLMGWNGGSTYGVRVDSARLADRASRANGNLYIDDNFGCGIVGTYASTRYQGVFAMGDSYKLPADGTSTGSLYGMAWSHPNTGGVAGNLSSHGLILMQGGNFMCALSTDIVAAGNINTYSDERLKTNWRDLPENFVACLAQVKSGVYDRTDGDQITQVGVSAQSLQAILPEAITTTTDDMRTLSVNYGGAALASAVELAKDNVELRTRIEKLEAIVLSLLNKE